MVRANGARWEGVVGSPQTVRFITLMSTGCCPKGVGADL